MSDVIRKDLGIATAYGYAVSQGYSGTEQQFAALMAAYATVGQQAQAAKDDAVSAKTAAQAAQTAAETAAAALVIDANPTASSEHAVSSGGVYTALAGKETKITENKRAVLKGGVPVTMSASRYGWTKQTISATDAEVSTSTTRWRTDFISADGIAGFKAGSGYKFAVYVYNGDKTYQGIYTDGSFVKAAHSETGDLLLGGIPDGYFIRVLLAKTDDSSITDITPYEHITEYDYTDKTLTKSGEAADAAIAGELFGLIEIPVFRTGVRRENGSVYTNTEKTITFSNYLYVGAGTRVRVILRRNFKYTLLSGANSSGSINTVISGSQLSEFVAPYDYIALNVAEYDDSDQSITLSAAEVNTNHPIILFKGDYAQADSDIQPDVPENLGVINTILNARQLTEIQYTPVATMPVMSGDFEADAEIKGMVYSSARQEGLFCANSVSLHTFMTAVLNPNSYLYTRESSVSNSKTYYGAVCSTFVGYCYGLRDYIPTTYMLDKIDGMERIENQTAYGLKLGDMLLKSGEHAMIVTKIMRNRRNGMIDSITISEAWPRVCRTQKKTVAQINTWLSGNYVAYRYGKIYAVEYTPSPWVLLENETGTPEYSTHLSPRRGDKAVWRDDEDIEIDVLSAGDYTSYKLYKGTTLQDTVTLSGDLITLEDLDTGNYKLCLTDETSDSEFVYFNVVGSSETYTPLGDGAVKVAFSGSNGTPTSIAWNYRAQDHGGKSYVIFQIDELTAAQISAGEATVTTETPGSYMLRVTYRNEFGLYYSDVQEVAVT
ncbi:MAG: hypothetical protein J5556_03470 [Deltaproteobacteria bacterium]|nr:hypothetical protein [Deltaproteobacteria bacterium]